MQLLQELRQESQFAADGNTPDNGVSDEDDYVSPPDPAPEYHSPLPQHHHNMLDTDGYAVDTDGYAVAGIDEGKSLHIGSLVSSAFHCLMHCLMHLNKLSRAACNYVIAYSFCSFLVVFCAVIKRLMHFCRLVYARRLVRQSIFG